jgi:ABC-type molybdate transport system substrate-binding protein
MPSSSGGRRGPLHTAAAAAAAAQHAPAAAFSPALPAQLTSNRLHIPAAAVIQQTLQQQEQQYQSSTKLPSHARFAAQIRLLQQAIC